MLILLLLTFSVNAQSGQKKYQSYYPKDLSARNSFACGMGEAKGCQPISHETLKQLDQCAVNTNIDGPVGDIGFLLMNRYADTLFFQELANRSVIATDCQVQILSAETSPLVESGWKVFQTIQPLLSALIELRDQESKNQEQEIRRLSTNASDISVNRVLSKRTDRFKKINASIDKLLAEIPYGEHEITKSALRNLAGKNVTQEQFSSAYTEALPKLKAKYLEAQKTFQGIKNNKTGEYELSFAQKVELYRAPASQEMLKQLDPKGTSLRCRFNSCYVKGPRNEKFAAMIGLAGVTALSLGTTSPFLAGAAAVGAASFSLTQAYDSCTQKTLSVSADVQRTCSPDHLAQTTLSQMNRTNCAVDATLLALDVLLPGLAGARKLAQVADQGQTLVVASKATKAEVSTLSLGNTKATQMLHAAPEAVIVVTAPKKKILVNNKFAAKETPAIRDNLKHAVEDSPELKTAYEEIQYAYMKGQEGKELRYEILALENAKPKNVRKIKKLKRKLADLDRQIEIINDRFIKNMHGIYAEAGIPSKMVKNDQGSLVLELDFTVQPKNSKAFKFWKEIHETFKVKNVTLSLKDNAQAGFGGFFQPGAGRLDMGPAGAISLLDDYVNSIGKHEARHAMLMAMRMKGDDSIYHTVFSASQDGKLLNDFKMYDGYMSSEELYTFSTDLQSLAKVFKDDFVTNPAKRDGLLEQITDQSSSLQKVASSQENLAKDFITSIDDSIKKNDFSEVSINKGLDGNYHLNLLDSKKRQSLLSFVSPAEKKMFEKLLKSQDEMGVSFEKYFKDQLTKKGVDYQDLNARFPDKLTASESTMINELNQNFIQSPSGKLAEQNMAVAKIEILQSARKRFKDLQDLSVIQRAEGEKLEKLISAYKDPANGGKPQQLEAVRSQMFHTAKNVKEDYKGFALNNRSPAKN